MASEEWDVGHVCNTSDTLFDPSPADWGVVIEPGARADYAAGSLCRNHEMPSQPVKPESGMVWFNMSIVGDDFECKGGVYTCPSPLGDILQKHVTEINEAVKLFKARQLQAYASEMSSLSSTSTDGVPIEERPTKMRKGATRKLQQSKRSLTSGETPSMATLRNGVKRLFDGNDGCSGLTARMGTSDNHNAVTDKCTQRQPQADSVDGLTKRASSSMSVAEQICVINSEHSIPINSEEEVASKKEEIALSDAKRLGEFYMAALRYIQQTHCRAIGQTWIKVVHPKKQSKCPYNGGKTAREKGRDGDGTLTAPHWWPEDIPHVEPAHLKTSARMPLLLHILCKLYHTEGTGPKGKGVCAADLKSMTDLETKLDERARYWLNMVYHTREKQEQYEDGGREHSTLWLAFPPKRKSRYAGKHQKVDASLVGDGRQIKFEDETRRGPEVPEEYGACWPGHESDDRDDEDRESAPFEMSDLGDDGMLITKKPPRNAARLGSKPSFAVAGVLSSSKNNLSEIEPDVSVPAVGPLQRVQTGGQQASVQDEPPAFGKDEGSRSWYDTRVASNARRLSIANLPVLGPSQDYPQMSIAQSPLSRDQGYPRYMRPTMPSPTFDHRQQGLIHGNRSISMIDAVDEPDGIIPFASTQALGAGPAPELSVNHSQGSSWPAAQSSGLYQSNSPGLPNPHGGNWHLPQNFGPNSTINPLLPIQEQQRYEMLMQPRTNQATFTTQPLSPSTTEMQQGFQNINFSISGRAQYIPEPGYSNQRTN